MIANLAYPAFLLYLIVLVRAEIEPLYGESFITTFVGESRSYIPRVEVQGQCSMQRLLLNCDKALCEQVVVRREGRGEVAATLSLDNCSVSFVSVLSGFAV